jgi:hypothetical protein
MVAQANVIRLIEERSHECCERDLAGTLTDVPAPTNASRRRSEAKA